MTVWAGISKQGATNIAVFNTTIDSKAYQNILRTHLLPFIRNLPSHRFQQNNAPAHRSLSTRTYLQDKVNELETPPESPVLNATENVCYKLKNYIRTVAKPTCKDELLAVIQNFWATMTDDKCCRYINHFKKVMSKVIEVNREATGY